MKATCTRLKKGEMWQEDEYGTMCQVGKGKSYWNKGQGKGGKSTWQSTIGKEKDSGMQKAKEKGSKAIVIIAVKQDILPDCAPTATLKGGHHMEKLLETSIRSKRGPSMETVTRVEQKDTKPTSAQKEKAMANHTTAATVEKAGKEVKEAGTMKYQAPPQTGKGEKLAY